MIRILVLEDHDQMRQALVEALEDEGYDVSVATRGEDAVKMAQGQPYDLLITDIRMEGMDGLEALRHVQQHQPGIHSMVVTGYSTEDDSIRAIQLGAGDYLRKPFKLNHFLKRVNRLVAGRLRQLEKTANVELMRQTCLRLSWALAELLDEKSLQAGRLTAWLCQQMGRPIHQNFVRAVSTALLQNTEDAPAALEGLQLETEPHEPSLDHNIVKLAVVAVRESDFSPEDFEPFLVSLLNLYHSGQLETLEQLLQEAATASTGLYQMGRTLERVGDLEGATKAYQTLLERPDSRDAIEGSLGLSRIEHRRESYQAAEDHLKEAVQTARTRGAAVTGEVLLEAALSSLDWGMVETEQWLTEASTVLEQVGDRVSLAETRLAIAHFSLETAENCEESLDLLMSPENRQRFMRLTGWAVPVILRLAADDSEGYWAALSLLARELPETLCQAAQTDLSVVAKETLLKLVRESGNSKLEGVPKALLGDPAESVRRAANLALSELRSQDQPPPLVVYSMGPLQVFLGSERLDESAWKTAKTKYLLAYLVGQGGKPVSDDRLVELFWPGPIQKGKRSLNTALSVLRKVLRPEGWDGDLEYFVRGAGKVQFNTRHPYWHDLEELERARDQARKLEKEGRGTDGVPAHHRVCHLYRGAYLKECYYDWADGLRTQLEQDVIHALTRVAQNALQTHQTQRALEAGQQLVEITPCEEHGYKLAMEALIKLGRHGQAVKLYADCEKTLRAELDMEPTIDLIRLHQMALLGQSAETIG
jgi:two-component SAPR family response regulator